MKNLRLPLLGASLALFGLSGCTTTDDTKPVAEKHAEYTPPSSATYWADRERHDAAMRVNAARQGIDW